MDYRYHPRRAKAIAKVCLVPYNGKDGGYRNQLDEEFWDFAERGQRSKVHLIDYANFEKGLIGSNYSPLTVRAYTDDVRQYLTFVQGRRVDWDNPIRLDRRDIVEFINHLAARHATGVTRFRKLASLRKFFRFLQEN